MPVKQLTPGISGSSLLKSAVNTPLRIAGRVGSGIKRDVKKQDDVKAKEARSAARDIKSNIKHERSKELISARSAAKTQLAKVRGEEKRKTQEHKTAELPKRLEIRKVFKSQRAAKAKVEKKKASKPRKKPMTKSIKMMYGFDINSELFDNIPNLSGPCIKTEE